MKERDKQILLYSMNVWNGEKWVFFWGNWERKI